MSWRRELRRSFGSVYFVSPLLRNLGGRVFGTWRRISRSLEDKFERGCSRKTRRTTNDQPILSYLGGRDLAPGRGHR